MDNTGAKLRYFCICTPPAGSFYDRGGFLICRIEIPSALMYNNNEMV